jgi:hypothetical protein
MIASNMAHGMTFEKIGSAVEENLISPGEHHAWPTGKTA